MPCAEVPTFSGSSGAPVIIPQGESSEVIGMIHSVARAYLISGWPLGCVGSSVDAPTEFSSLILK